MKKFLLSWLCLIVAFVTWAETTVDLAFTNKLWGNTWSTTSYSDRTLKADNYTVTITKASKQSGTVTDVPVVKASDITLKMTSEGATLANATVHFKQWNTKEQKAKIAYSTDGTNFTELPDRAETINASTLSITTGTLPDDVIAVKVSTTNTSNQVGIVSIVFEENYAGPIDYTPAWENVSLMEGETKQLELGGNHPEISFVSSNTAVATIDADGLITAAGVGTATITATWGSSEKFNAGSASFVVEVTEYVKVTSATIDFTKNTSSTTACTASNFISTFSLSDKIASVTTCSYAYPDGDKGVKLAKSGNNGVLDFTVVDDLKGKVSKIIFNAAGTKDGCTLTVSVAGVTDKVFNLQNSTFDDYVIEFDTPADLTNIKMTGISKKQIDVKTITIIYASAEDENKLARPVFTPAAGEVLVGTEVTIAAAEGEVHYSTDGTEPDANSPLYSAPIVVDKAMTIKAIAISGDKKSDVATADYTLIATSTLAEAIAMEKGSKYVMGDNLTVTYAYGDYLYVTANGAYGLVYTKDAKFNESYTAGDVIKAGWSGKVDIYNSLVELVPDAVADLVKDGTAEVPAPKTLTSVAELTAEVVNMPVVIKNVTIEAATPEGAASFTGTIKGDSETIGLYNRFNLPSVEPGVYDIEGMGNIFKETLQVYVTSMTPVVLETCAAPTFSIATSEVEYGTEVTISTATEGATIVYTINEGDVIISEGNSVTITVDKDMDIEAYATKEGCVDSEITSEAYLVYCATPTFSIPAGEVAVGTVVTLSATTKGATIAYTINDGDVNISESNSVDITINSNSEITAFAAVGDLNSEIATATYTVTCPYDVEVLTPGYAETVMLGQNGEPAVIELASAALEGVTIYHKHVEPAIPDTPESVIARAVDHTGFSAAETNENNNHVITVTKPGTVTYYGYHADSDTKGVERTIKVIPYDDTLGVEGIGDDIDGTATFYTLQGVRVETPAAGNVYIMVKGNKATKVLVK